MQKTIKPESAQQNEADHKRIASGFFDLVKQGRFRDGLKFFAPDCITHNPYVAGDMNALVNAMDAANNQGQQQYPNAEFTVRNVLADGDFVAVHTQLLNDKAKPGEGGLRQVHLFRFSGDKIVEYWDITQQVLPNMPNAAGAF